jgi:pimeloyl-ACP methyl ester carboxylesterase
MQNLILLHGAIGASDQLTELAARLSDSYSVFTLDFSGHGGRSFPEGAFSIEHFAGNVLNFMDEKSIETTSIFGYSMGGYVGMYLAKHHPRRISKLVTLATKFYWDEATAAGEVKMLDADKIQAKVPAFAKALEARHAPNDWKEVLQNTANMLHALGQRNCLELEDYREISTPCLVMLGDRDKMITLQETIDVSKTLPNAGVAMLPNTSHPIEQVNPDTLSFFIKSFVG